MPSMGCTGHFSFADVVCGVLYEDEMSMDEFEGKGRIKAVEPKHVRSENVRWNEK